MPTYRQVPVNWVDCRARLFRKERNLNELISPKIAARTVQPRPERIFPTHPKPVGKEARFRLHDLRHWLRMRLWDRGERPPSTARRLLKSTTDDDDDPFRVQQPRWASDSRRAGLRIERSKLAGQFFDGLIHLPRTIGRTLRWPFVPIAFYKKRPSSRLASAAASEGTA